MKVEFITRTELKIEKYDYRNRIVININNEKVFDIRDDEPEDSNLSRSFSDCYKITNLIRKAYNAGRNGEDFELKEIESDDI